MKRLKVLLVGIGGYGSGYLRSLTGRDLGADVAGVVDVMPDIRERCPELDRFSIPLYRSIADFYRENTADLAILSSPIHLHTAMSVECMQNGSHVLCEKPLCLTLEDAALMDDVSAKTGKFLCVGYQMNYRRDVQKLKSDILSGKYGAPLRLRCVHAYRRGSKYYARNNWAGKICVNGHEVFDSPFTNACAHNFQMLTFLLGKTPSAACDITDLEGEVYRANPLAENYDIACLRFKTDTGAMLNYYTAHPLSSEVLGPYGCMEFEKGVITFSEDERFCAHLHTGEVIDYGKPMLSPYDQKLTDVLECVRLGQTPVCTTASEIGHIRAVRMVQALPVKNVDEERIDIVEDEMRGTCRHVKDLEKILISCAESWKLPSEMGFRL